jgi:hypothetical protein
MRNVIQAFALVVILAIGGVGSVAVPMSWYDLTIGHKDSAIVQMCTSCHG